MTSFFFCRRRSDLDKISETGAERHVDGGDVVEMETRNRIPIWRSRTFGRIQWHVISEPRITLQGATTWWIHCHDFRATCHIAGAVTWWSQCRDRATLQGVKFHPPYWKSFFAIFYFLFLFLMQFSCLDFRLWRAAAFVSSPIHLIVAKIIDINIDRTNEQYNSTNSEHWARHTKLIHATTSWISVRKKTFRA